MAIAKLDQQSKSVRFSEFEISHELIFKYFDRLPEAQRDAALTRALQIGVAASSQKDSRSADSRNVQTSRTWDKAITGFKCSLRII